MSERVLPGVSIREVTEGLTGIPAVGLVAAKLVGTACKGPLDAQYFGPSELSKFVNTYGPADPYEYSGATGTNPPMELTLVRAGKLMFNAAPPGGVWVVRAAESDVQTAVGNAVTSGTEATIEFTAKQAGAWFNNFEWKHEINENALGETVTESNTFWMKIPSYDYFDSSIDTSKETARISMNQFFGIEIGFEYNAVTAASTATCGDFTSQWTGTNNAMLSALFDVAISGTHNDSVLTTQTTYLSLYTSGDTGGTNISGGTQPDEAAIGTGAISAGLELLRGVEARLTVIAGASEVTDFSGMIALGQGHVVNESADNVEQMYICGISNYASQDTMVAAVLTATALGMSNERVVKVAPGIIDANPYYTKGTTWEVSTVSTNTQSIVSGGYAAALVAGVIAQNVPDESPMNKSIPVSGLEFRLSLTNKKRLVRDNYFLLVDDDGYRTLRDLTTAPEGDAFYHVSTRMAIDDIKRAVRLAGRPFIGKKNNNRIRSTLKRNLEEVLRGYVRREIILPEWSLNVEASRIEQVLGVVTVTMVIQPVFYIEFIEVTLVLE